MQVQKRPPKSCTPMMAKIKKNNPTTMETLAMDASDRVTDRKTSIMPGLLVNVLQQRAPVTRIEAKGHWCRTEGHTGTTQDRAAKHGARHHGTAQ